MTGLVSFSLFGDDPNGVYFEGAVKNAYEYAHIYPNWDLWFYIGDSVPDSVIQQIKRVNPNVSFEFVHEIEDQTSTWWRYRALQHTNHDFVIFRDTDSRPWRRETTAVEEWLDSPYTYHVIRDHQFHGRQLLAGLWGVKRASFPALRKMPDRISGDYYGTDQIALLTYVWPDCRRKIMAHIGCYWIFEKSAQRRPLTVRRSEKEPFCAQGLDANDNPRYPEHIPMVDPDIDLRRRDDIFMEEYRVPRADPGTISGSRAKPNLFYPLDDPRRLGGP